MPGGDEYRPRDVTPRGGGLIVWTPAHPGRITNLRTVCPGCGKEVTVFRRSGRISIHNDPRRARGPRLCPVAGKHWTLLTGGA